MTENKTFDWNKFDKSLDLDSLKEDVEKAAEGGDYPDIPHGKYEVKIAGMELGVSKVKDDGTGADPMLKIQFKILEGEFENQLLFYNGVMQPKNDKAFGYQVHKNNVLLSDISDSDVHFNGFEDYAKEIGYIFADVKDWEYLLNYDKDKKGYDTWKIEEIFE